MSQVTFTPSKDYSIIHSYSYKGKSYFSEGVDYATYFLRLALGSEKIKLTINNVTWLAEKTTPNYPLQYVVRLGALALSFFCYRFTAVSIFALGVKYFICNEPKKLSDLARNTTTTPSPEPKPNPQPTKPTSDQKTNALTANQKLMAVAIDTSLQRRELPKDPLNFKEVAPNKAYIYSEIRQGSNVTHDSIRIRVISIPKDDFTGRFNSFSMFGPLEIKHQLKVDALEGSFCFEENQGVTDWFASYSSPESLFNPPKNDKLKSEDLLGIEHPALYHIGADQKISPQKNEVALIEQVKRYGKLDMTKIAPPFDKATKEQIEKCLKICDDPKESKIFSLTTPDEDIEGSFYRTVSAFMAIKNECVNSKTESHIHIRITETNKLKNLVLFIAITRLTGIEKITFYDQKKPDSLLREACKIHNQIKKDHPNFSIGDFINHMKTIQL